MIQIKERKEMEDAFKKAQKPWSKLLQKVNKAKADYHTACKQEKSASNQERNATGDSSFSMDQVQARTFWLMLILSGVLLNLFVSITNIIRTAYITFYAFLICYVITGIVLVWNKLYCIDY